MENTAIIEEQLKTDYSTDETNVEKRPKSASETENSEDYDSAEDDSSSYSEDDKGKSRSRASDDESHSEEEVEGNIQERQSGDGQESIPAKKVDDDEDKKNPQYIPKRGTFYEHDDRTAEEEENDSNKVEEKDAKTKKVWADKKERWSHDKFNDSEQAPKSKSELIAIYGYDIRNEDGPPRARRRRRYGRGPNKYTRNWEDEDAYNKAQLANKVKKPVPPKKTRDREEYPPLNRTRQSDNDENISKPNVDNERKSQEKNLRNSVERTDNNKDNTYAGPTNPAPLNNSSYNNTQEPTNNKLGYPKVGSGRVIKSKKEIKDSDYLGFTTKTRQTRMMKNDQQKVLPPRNKKDEYNPPHQQHYSSTRPAHNTTGLEKDMARLSVHHHEGGLPERSFPGRGVGGQSAGRHGSVPPRLQEQKQQQGGAPKRYSSMRQRSLPETGAPPHTAAAFSPSFYPSDYNSTAPPPPSQQPIMVPPPAMTQPPTAAPPPQLIHQQFPGAGGAPFGAGAPPPTPAAAFLHRAGAAPPPAAFLPAPPPPGGAPMVSYPQHQLVAAAAAAAGFQGFQGQFSAVTQPAELYQPQGGITYYSTDQQIMQRMVPQKRPKAAIPIIAPDEMQSDGFWILYKDP